MQGLRSAISFLTILPIGPRDTTTGLASARAWFPVVGLLLGGILASADLIMQAAFVGESEPPPLLVAAILIIALVALTRALHLDGFMDCCDALFGGFDRERRLEIMRDPRVGAFAVAGAVSLLLVKVAAIMSLPHSGRVWILLLFPCLSRWTAVLAMQAFPYVRRQGIGTPFMASGGYIQLVIAFGTTAIAALALAGPSGLAIASLVSAIGLGVGAWASRQLGGVTGDVYGAVIETAEVSALLAGVFLAQDSALPVAPLIQLVW